MPLLIESMISATCRKRLIVTKNVLQEIRSMRFKYEAIFYRRVRFYKCTSVCLCLGFLLIRFLTDNNTAHGSTGNAVLDMARQFGPRQEAWTDA